MEAAWMSRDDTWIEPFLLMAARMFFGKTMLGIKVIIVSSAQESRNWHAV
jgi:hypothetical protein